MNRTEPVRVLLVDDNPAVLRQIAQVLPGDFEIVDALTSGDALHATIEAQRPDVVVLDITLPGQSGIVLASQICKSGDHVGVVFLTMHHDTDYLRSALSAGASGYVVKMRLAVDLEPALRAAAAGERFISPIPELQFD